MKLMTTLFVVLFIDYPRWFDSTFLACIRDIASVRRWDVIGYCFAKLVFQTTYWLQSTFRITLTRLESLSLSLLSKRKEESLSLSVNRKTQDLGLNLFLWDEQRLFPWSILLWQQNVTLLRHFHVAKTSFPYVSPKNQIGIFNFYLTIFRRKPTWWMRRVDNYLEKSKDQCLIHQAGREAVAGQDARPNLASPNWRGAQPY